VKKYKVILGNPVASPGVSFAAAGTFKRATYLDRFTDLDLQVGEVPFQFSSSLFGRPSRSRVVADGRYEEKTGDSNAAPQHRLKRPAGTRKNCAVET